ncbi:MAG: TMEM165/GDT1 family protein [Actinomycetota bacterium]|nr:TMEM165/GDT1 family protein [Actinomycetota bacterium]
MELPMSLHDLLQAFATVFPAELPDKTMIATIILVTRYRRPLWVWAGAVSAFAVHVVVAVAAGSLIGLLPDTVVKLVVTALFLTGAVLLFRAARQAEDDDDPDDEAPATSATVKATVVGSFGLVVLAEWGDLTQLATASLAADSSSPVSTGIGALLALASVAGIAATFGRQLVARVPIHKVNYVGAAVFAGLALWTLIELVTS